MIKSLISLRGIFILFVFFHHAGVYPGGGSMGVAFFFILSGFSMTLGYKDRVLLPSFDYKQYLKRRCVKFYPLHWLTLIADIPYVLMSTLHWWLIPVFFVNAALLQTLLPIENIYFSYNAVSWFLSDILFFSMVFPFLFKKIFQMSNKRRLFTMIFVMLVYIIIAALSFKLPDGVQKGIIYISPFVRLMDFVLGILLGLDFLVKEKSGAPLLNEKKRAISVALITVIVLLIVESYILGDKLILIAPLYWPLVAILIYLAALPKEEDYKWLNNTILIKLGECSFTIFLVHRLVLRYTGKLLAIENKIIYVLFCLVVTIVLSLLIEKYILNNITQWLSKRI